MSRPADARSHGISETMPVGNALLGGPPRKDADGGGSIPIAAEDDAGTARRSEAGERLNLAQRRHAAKLLDAGRRLSVWAPVRRQAGRRDDSASGKMPKGACRIEFSNVERHALCGQMCEKTDELLPDFTDDLFISYAHVDNLPLRKGAEGWITLLHNSLETRLRQLLGQKLIVWRDRKLWGNDEFGDELIERLNNVGLLISILSPSYVTSKWCVKEVQEFCATTKRNVGLKLGNKSRLFKVVKTPVKRERYPAEMVGQLGYEFYVEEGDDRFRELIGDLQDKVFWDKHEDLAQDIRETIDLLRGQKISPAGATMYVAYSSSDVPERDRLVRELRELGHQILPESPLPMIMPDFEQATRECLARSQLAIHLIGGRYGIVPEGETRSVIELQERLAADVAATSGIDRILWIRPHAVVKEGTQLKFIERLEHEVAEQVGVELIRAEYEDFKSFVTHRLSSRKESSRRAKKSTRIQVYLIYDNLDSTAVKPLDDRFFERGYEVLRPIVEGTPTQPRDAHKEDLLSCDAVLIYQGESDEFWLRTKLRDLDKAPGYGRSAPFMSKGIFIGPSRTAFKEQFRRHDALVMKSLDGVVPDALQPFLAQLESPRAKAG